MDPEKEPGKDKKIIIDEDWKAQVHAEKEQAAPTARESPAQPAAAKPKHSLPAASISFLVTTLATQAFVALGLIPHPATNKPEKDLDQAKLFIDTLGVLEEKTRGNLTPEEKRPLDAILYDLRMQFIEMTGPGSVAEKSDARRGV